MFCDFLVQVTLGNSFTFLDLCSNIFEVMKWILNEKYASTFLIFKKCSAMQFTEAFEMGNFFFLLIVPEALSVQWGTPTWIHDIQSAIWGTPDLEVCGILPLEHLYGWYFPSLNECLGILVTQTKKDPISLYCLVESLSCIKEIIRKSFCVCTSIQTKSLKAFTWTEYILYWRIRKMNTHSFSIKTLVRVK